MGDDARASRAEAIQELSKQYWAMSLSITLH